jgi:hypothetical protein
MRIPHWRMSLLGLVFISRTFASACVTDTLFDYITLLPVTGCTLADGIVVKTFAFSVVATSLGSPLTSGAITVTPFGSGTCTMGSPYQLCFSATGGTPATGFMVSGTDFAKYEIDFNWDPLISGAEDDMVANTPVFPGTATVTTKLCNGQAFGGVTCPTFASPTNTLKVFSDGIPADAIPKATTILTPPMVLPGVVIGTTSLVDLEGNTTGSSKITGFNTSLLTPEPGTLLPMAAAVLALVCRGFRRRRQPPL